jgi:hypothetical protein
VLDAAMRGNIELVRDHVTADAACVNTKDDEYDPPPHRRS